MVSHPPLSQALEQLAVRLGLSQALVGDDVGRRIEGRLDGDLERMQHESGFPDVSKDLGRARQRPELLDARLDEGELLSQEIGVGHGVGRGRRR